MVINTHITLFDRPYPKDKQAEVIAISEAVVTGMCDKCICLAQCKSADSFVSPAFAWCSRRKQEILDFWEKEDDDGKATD